MAKSIREHFELTSAYHSLCREERNLCALLYYLLLSNPENLARFLKAIGHEAAKLENAEIYVEYAHLRDIWYALGKCNRTLKEKKNEIRRDFILKHLGLQHRKQLTDSTVQEFNAFFVARKTPSSSKVIESPSNWSIKQIHNSFPVGTGESDKFIRAAHFKWSFNVKPDIVIFLSPEKAISIEAKLEGGESMYPSSKVEKSIFTERKIGRASQTEIQELVFKILGINANHVVLAKKGGNENKFAWEAVLRQLDVEQEPAFVRKQFDSFLERCSS